jgi:membrane protein YqaA with SNARE-associated domain
MPNDSGVEFCAHCGVKMGTHRRVPWWHLHRKVYDWTIAWAYRPSAAVALFVLSFAESSFFPLPPDALLIPLVLGNRKKWLRYALLCSIASVLGGVAGYFIGLGAWEIVGQYFFDWIPGFTQEKFSGISDAYEKWNFWVVFTAGFTPIPFKVITITAGVFKINFAIFLVAATVSRSARFFLVAGLCRKFGPKVTPFIEKYLGWLSLAFAVLLVGGFLVFKYVL